MGKITCPLCLASEDGEEPTVIVLRDWKEYAKHILKVHPDDERRCIWAKDALEAENEMLVETVKYKGKPVEQVPVARRSTLPPLTRRILEAEDKKHGKGKSKKTKANKSPEDTTT